MSASLVRPPFAPNTNTCYPFHATTDTNPSLQVDGCGPASYYPGGYKAMGAALEAAPKVYVSDGDLLAAFEGLDAAEVFRTSQATLMVGAGPADTFRLSDVAGVAVEPLKAEGTKCARSWRILPEVGTDPRYPDLSLRDAAAVAAWDAARA